MEKATLKERVRVAEERLTAIGDGICGEERRIVAKALDGKFLKHEYRLEGDTVNGVDVTVGGETVVSLRYENFRPGVARRFTIRIDGFGEVGRKDFSRLTAIRMAGAIAEAFTDIEAGFAVLDWADFDEAYLTYRRLRDELAEAEKAEKAA